MLNGHVSPEDVKLLVLSDSETDDSAEKTTPPARHGKKSGKTGQVSNCASCFDQIRYASRMV